MKPLVLAGMLCLGITGAYASDDNGSKAKDSNGDATEAGENGKVVFEINGRARVNSQGATNSMVYHGGPLMTGTPHAYLIWYGSWDASSQAIITDLASNIGGSPYFNINKTYSTSTLAITGLAQYGGTAHDAYSQGKNLSDAAIQTIVSHAIANGLPKDTNGVYFVLTSQDVNETSGFCTQYCGWHTRGTIAGSDIKYSFVGNPARCPSACTAQPTTSPNGNVGADGMASIFAHELEETVTDPDLNAWFDRTGQENADKCAWTFGTTKTASNGSQYNITLGSRQYLIQRNWSNATNACAMQ